MSQKWLPTGDWVLWCLTPALVLIATGLDRNYQTDLWHHLARGRAMVAERRLVNEDLFSCTVLGQPFPADANWLTQVLYFELYELGGLDLLQTVNSLLLAATLTGLVWLCRRRSGSLRLAALLGVFTFFGLWQILLIRPQTFSLLFFVLLMIVLELASARRWLLLVPPVVIALWVNMHGAFPVGVLLVGGHCLGLAWEAARNERVIRFEWRQALARVLGDRNVRRWLLCTAACAAATLVNPYGLDIYEFVGVTSSRSSSRGIQEWLPPRLDTLIGKLWVASILLALVSFALVPRRPAARDVFLMLCFLPISCSAVRMVAWWLLVLAPVVAVQLAELVPTRWLTDEEGREPALMAGIMAAFLALMALASLPVTACISPLPAWLGRQQRLEDDLDRVASALRSEPTASRRLFSRLDWGEYLAWSLAPDGYLVFIDGRIDVYPDDVWAEYLAVLRGRADWEEILAKYDVTCLVLDATHGDQVHGILPLARQSANWRQRTQVGPAAVFDRVR